MACKKPYVVCDHYILKCKIYDVIFKLYGFNSALLDTNSNMEETDILTACQSL